MDARTLSIKTVFGQDRQHVVPLYQRPYVWERKKQLEPLWDDVRGVAERLVGNRPTRAHFLGAIVLDQVRQPTGHVERRLVIDGQQRLTTMQLLLEAFAEVCQIAGAERHYKALIKLTRNDDPLSQDADEQFKVWPTNVDRHHFRTVMEATSPAEVCRAYEKKSVVSEVGHAIADAYLYFFAAIEAWLRPLERTAEARVDALLNTLADYVRMVVIDLGPEDDAQVIFETLNARGTPLLPADLVKNFIYHRAQLEGENVDRLYATYWQPFDDDAKYWREEVGRGHAERARIDTFLLHYLTLKTREEVSPAQLYSAFRDQSGAAESNRARDQLKAIRTYAEVYRGFDHMPPETPEGVFFERLGITETTTAYPFLLELFARYAEDHPEAVRGVLRDIESFLIRRMVCQLSTRGYNKLFVDLLPSLDGDAATLPGRVRELLLASEAEANRWPDDTEFRQAWLDVPVFRVLRRARVRMLLEALERQSHGGKTERIEFREKLTVEHLLPQEWQRHWPLPSGVPEDEAERRRERLLHTMGNLTLLTKKLNPSVSNGPWERKRSAILQHSALNLNRPLPGDWGEARIEERGRALFEVAQRLWPRPGQGAPRRVGAGDSHDDS